MLEEASEENILRLLLTSSTRDITINSPTPTLTEAPLSLLDISNNDEVYYLYPYQGGMGLMKNRENEGNNYAHRNKSACRRKD